MSSVQRDGPSLLDQGKDGGLWGSPRGLWPARDPPVTRRGTEGEPREGEAWGSCDKSRKLGGVPEMYKMGNDTSKCRTRKTGGLEPPLTPGTGLMRLFLSPSVPVYYSGFKGGEQRRPGRGAQETGDAEPGGGGRAPGPQGAFIWMPAPGRIRSRPQPGAGGSRLQGGLINFITDWEMGWFPNTLASDLSLCVSFLHLVGRAQPFLISASLYPAVPQCVHTGVPAARQVV